MITGIILRAKRPDAPNFPERSIRNAHAHQNDFSFITSETYAFAHKSTHALNNHTGVIEGMGYITFLCGEPCLSRNGAAVDHRCLTEDIKNGSWESLKKVRGTFVLVFYDLNNNAAYLISDKLGVRPLYHWIREDIFAFSTRFKCLMAMPFISKERCEHALSETVVFGYPLGTRTCAKDVAVLGAGEILKITPGSKTSERYWKWDEISEKALTVEKATQTATEIFSDSLRIRMDSDTRAGAFLSGGMDSRTIVAQLSAHGVKTVLYNFSPTNSQDLAFASLFAQQLDVPLISSPRDEPLHRGFRLHLAELTSSLLDGNPHTLDRPRALWSGDGGSVGLGCVHLDHPMVDAMRAGKEDEALSLFCKKNYFSLPLKFFRRSKQKEYSRFVTDTIKTEMSTYNCNDPANKLFLFLMLNDQRRHLYDFYEEIDSHGLEYQLPFYDSSFLEFIFSLPLDTRLNHKFYHEWFKTLSPTVTAVPWQTYPGHVPCPIQDGKNLEYQWAKGKKKPVRERLFAAREGFEISFSSSYIGPMSRSQLVAVSTIHSLGIKNLSHVLEAAKLYSRPLTAH